MDIEEFFSPSTIDNLKDIGASFLANFAAFWLYSKIRIVSDDYNIPTNVFGRHEQEAQQRW